MSVTCKRSQAVSAYEGANGLLNLPDLLIQKVGYPLAYIKAAVSDTHAEFLRWRLDLVMELGEEKKNSEGVKTGEWSPKPENRLEYDKAIDDYLNQEVEIKTNKVRLTDFGDAKAPGRYIDQLFAFIDNTSPEKK